MTIADVVEALNILAEHAGGDAPVDTEVLLVGPPDLGVDPYDRWHLESLGWFVDQDTRRWARRG